jgi:uncharacterized protein YdeI (YjbR/CyaY-like superfamily)
MPQRDPRIDAYIAKAAPFARPILEHLREIVHRGCPEAVETMKWSMPFFEHHGVLCNMAAFKAHCAFGFWKSKLVAETGKESDAMGQLGRIGSRADLPADRTIVAWVRKAAALNESGEATARPKKRPKPALAVPDDLAAELAKKKNAAAKKTFDGFPPSHRREYVEWITGAKRPETRAKRLETTIAQLHEGKPQNWKYMAKK